MVSAAGACLEEEAFEVLVLVFGCGCDGILVLAGNCICFAPILFGGVCLFTPKTGLPRLVPNDIVA